MKKARQPAAAWAGSSEFRAPASAWFVQRQWRRAAGKVANRPETTLSGDITVKEAEDQDGRVNLGHDTLGHWELRPLGTWATGNLGHRELEHLGTWATWELGPPGTWATGNLGTWELGPPGNLGHWELIIYMIYMKYIVAKAQENVP